MASASISRPRQVSTRLPNSPLNWRKACRRWASVSALIRSPRPSTAVRSSRPFPKARRVNSPASAMRKPGRSAQHREYAGHDGAAAMHLQLGHVLAGLAPRSRKPQHQGFVDHLAGPGRANGRRWRGAVPGATRRGDQALAGARSGQANDGDRRRGPARRQGKDRIAVIAQLAALRSTSVGTRRPGPATQSQTGCRNLRRTILDHAHPPCVIL